MKKFIIGIVGVAVCLVVAVAATHRAPSFKKSTYPVQIAVNSSNLYSANLQWTNNLGQTIVAGTNSVGITYGSPFHDSIEVWATSTGEAGVLSFTVTSYGAVATSTNTLGYQLVKSVDGTYFDTTTTNQFTAQYAANGTNYITVTTNLPAWFVTGAKKIRLNRITATDSGATNETSFVVEAAIGGYVP